MASLFTLSLLHLQVMGGELSCASDALKLPEDFRPLPALR